MKTRDEQQAESTREWRATGSAAGFVIAVLLAVGMTTRAVLAQPYLVCGVPTTHHLDSGSTDTYPLAVSSDQQIVVDVTDTSGTLGLLQLTPLFYCSLGEHGELINCGLQTCNGSLAFLTSPILVSDCAGDDAGDYTVEFNVVAQSPENCGVPLSCGVAPAEAALSVRGEVDAYTFPGFAGQQVSLVTTATGDTTGSLRTRLFSPTGDLESDSCSGSLTFGVPSSGTYTVLVSACVAPSTGRYSIVWQTLPACPAAAAAAVAYITYTTSGTVGVVDLASDQTVSIVPETPADQYRDFSTITVSPNDGVAYATFGGSGTISIINTTLNRVVGSITVPFYGGQYLALPVAVDPEGRFAYTIASGLADYTLPEPVLPVAVINLATRKIDATIAIEGIHGLFEGGPLAISPDGKALYVSAVFSQTLPDNEGHVQAEVGLIVIDVASRTVVGRVADQRFSGEFFDISFNPTGALAYILQSGALYTVDTATRSVTHRLLLSTGGDIAYSPDGRIGYALGCVLAEGGGCADPTADFTLFVIDMSSLTITNTVPLQEALGGRNEAGNGGIAVSPDGARLVVVNPNAVAKRQQPPAAIVIDTASLQVVGTIQAVGDEPWDVAIVTPPSGLCTADDSGQTRVTVGELVSSVNYSVDGCPTARNRLPVVSP
jgi:hypothetical protein